MARLSINQMTMYRWPFERDVERLAAAGIPAVGVWRRKLTDYGEANALELLQKNGLAVSNLLWAGGFTGSDCHSFHESLEVIKPWNPRVIFAAAVSSRCFCEVDRDIGFDVRLARPPATRHWET